ncbi:MAG: questin oxidase family protein [Acidobacteriota bacterium]|nr:questin oxidase family protein [Acidobacteriota bacterium]
MTYSRRGLFGILGRAAGSAATAVGLERPSKFPGGTPPPAAAPEPFSSESDRERAARESALDLLEGTGPEYGGGLSNHGPMAADALIVLGRNEAVVPWLERYRRGLDSAPAARRAIGAGDWSEALGRYDRVGDWTAFFRKELLERPWTEVVSLWCERLAPGISAAAFHGVLRAAYAARNMRRSESPARRRELAEGLAYWAARSMRLPERPTYKHPETLRTPSDVLSTLESLPASQRGEGLIDERLQALNDLPSFSRVADLVDSSSDPSVFLTRVTEAFAAACLAHATPSSAIAWVHTVTGPSAVRLLLPHVNPPTARSLARYAWQGAAGIYAAYSLPVPRLGAGGEDRGDDLVDRAVRTGDEHAFKFVETCLREYAIAPRPVYLTAAGAMLDLLPVRS